MKEQQRSEGYWGKRMTIGGGEWIGKDAFDVEEEIDRLLEDKPVVAGPDAEPGAPDDPFQTSMTQLTGRVNAAFDGPARSALLDAITQLEAGLQQARALPAPVDAVDAAIATQVMTLRHQLPSSLPILRELLASPQLAARVGAKTAAALADDPAP